jgi:cyclase
MDIKGEKVIKGVHLECLRVVGDPQNLAHKYYEDGADEIVYMDIVASLYGRKNLMNIVERVSRQIFVPLTAGGGIKTLDDINVLLRVGADKVAINSQLLDNPDFANSAVKSFGSQCIVGSIEAKKTSDGQWMAFYNNGREPSGRSVMDWAKELESRGVGELLITSVDMEGTRKGYDIELTREISEMVKIPVIASGGAGDLGHIDTVLRDGKADAITLSSAIHFDKLKICDVKKHILQMTS